MGDSKESSGTSGFLSYSHLSGVHLAPNTETHGWVQVSKGE